MPCNLNLRQFIQRLRESGEVLDVHHQVDPNLELAEIHRRIATDNGPALFFHNVKNSSFPVVTNLFGSRRRINLAFPNHPEKILADLVKIVSQEFPPSLKKLWKKRHALKNLSYLGTKTHRSGPILEKCVAPPNLEKLPLLKTWPLDGGDFITLPLVYTESTEGGPPNLGMYRIQRYNQKEMGLHFQIQKGGGFHYVQAEQKKRSLPVTIFIGGPPALILSAITPLPENVSELLICGLMQGKKLSLCSSSFSPYPLISQCEFALVGKAKPKRRKLEGPFGDHYGYYSLKHPFPVFECEVLYHRKDAIYPATVVGKPKQEDFYIGEYLQELFSPLFPLIMPGVKDLWSYGESGFHSLGAAIVQERYYRECMTSAFRLLGEGQLSLTKFLLLTDQPIELRNFKKVLTTILERFVPETDLFIFSNLCLDTLDYTGPELNKGSRGVMLGIGKKKRTLPHTYQGALPSSVSKIAVYSPGCLVLEGEISPSILDFPSFQQWPLLILVDDLEKTLCDDTTFLWTVFTRFEPAADIHAKARIFHNHITYSSPVLIDARMKPPYPPEVQCDLQTAKRVSENWRHYFPR